MNYPLLTLDGFKKMVKTMESPVPQQIGKNLFKVEIEDTFTDINPEGEVLHFVYTICNHNGDQYAEVIGVFVDGEVKKVDMKKLGVYVEDNVKNWLR